MQDANHELRRRGYVRVADICERFGVLPSLVHVWKNRGYLPSSLKEGGKLWVLETEVEARYPDTLKCYPKRKNANRRQ